MILQPLFPPEECLWTCEKNAAARSSHLDTLSVDACRFMDVFDFMSEDAVKEMKKVGTKSDVNRFKRWLTIGRKADLPTHAYCCQHLKKCLVKHCIAALLLGLSRGWSVGLPAYMFCGCVWPTGREDTSLGGSFADVNNSFFNKLIRFGARVSCFWVHQRNLPYICIYIHTYIHTYINR